MDFPFPRRLFLDSGVVQLYFDYGEYIFDGGEISSTARIRRMPEGVADLDGLRLLAIVNRRNAFELAVSDNSILEAQERRNSQHTAWVFELALYWRETLASYIGDPFSGAGAEIATRLSGKSFGYLGSGDRELLRDACVLECDGFLTVDRRLTRNAVHLNRELEIRVLTPAEFAALLSPWAALF